MQAVSLIGASILQLQLGVHDGIPLRTLPASIPR